MRESRKNGEGSVLIDQRRRDAERKERAEKEMSEEAVEEKRERNAQSSAKFMRRTSAAQSQQDRNISKVKNKQAQRRRRVLNRIDKSGDADPSSPPPSDDGTESGSDGDSDTEDEDSIMGPAAAGPGISDITDDESEGDRVVRKRAPRKKRKPGVERAGKAGATGIPDRVQTGKVEYLTDEKLYCQNFPEPHEYAGTIRRKGNFPGAWGCPKAKLMEFWMGADLPRERDSGIDSLKVPTEENKAKAIGRFLDRSQRFERHRGCAGCGMVCAETDLLQKNVRTDMRHLRRNAVWVKEFLAQSAIGQSSHHVVRIDDLNGTAGYYAVAPSLVVTGREGRCTGYFCEGCRNPKEKKHSMFFNFDAGIPCMKQPSARPLYLFNELAMQSKIIFGRLVKLYSHRGREVSKALRKHMFALSHDAVENAGSAVFHGLNPDCKTSLSIVFVGSSDLFASFKARGFTEVGIDVEETAKRLTYLKESGNPEYEGISIPTHKTMGEKLKEWAGVVNGMAVLEDGYDADCVEKRMENEEDGSSLLQQANNATDLATHDIASVCGAVLHSHEKGGEEGEEVKKIKATVSKFLENEYTDMHNILSGAFPLLFPRGVPAMYCSGVFPDFLRKRLLLDYTGEYEKDEFFIFSLFSTMQRHDVNKGVGHLAWHSPGIWEPFIELANRPDCAEIMEKALEDPDSEEATEILKKVMPCPRRVGPNLPWSTLERVSEVY